MNKILIIEDDLEINALLADFLKEKGYAVHCQYDGLHVLDFLNKEKIDLIILDIMLPYRSGDIILSDVRKKFTIPVIISVKSLCFSSIVISTDALAYIILGHEEKNTMTFLSD